MNENTQSLQLPTINAGADWNDTWRNIAAGAATMFVNRELIKTIGGDKAYQTSEDGSVYEQGKAAFNGLTTGGVTLSPLLLIAGAVVVFLVLKD